MEVRDTGCCAVVELVDISEHKEAETMANRAIDGLKDLTRSFGRQKPFVYFTSVVGRVACDHASSRTDNYGLALADYIEQNGLGTVVRTIPEQRNWSGNTIKMWMWFPNYAAVKANYEKRNGPILATRMYW